MDTLPEELYTVGEDDARLEEMIESFSRCLKWTTNESVEAVMATPVYYANPKPDETTDRKRKGIKRRSQTPAPRKRKRQHWGH